MPSGCPVGLAVNFSWVIPNTTWAKTVRTQAVDVVVNDAADYSNAPQGQTPVPQLPAKPAAPIEPVVCVQHAFVILWGGCGHSLSYGAG
jgi:hypothetical protein